MDENGLLLALDLVNADEKLLKDGLIHQPPHRGARGEIDLVAAINDCQSLLESLQDVCRFVSRRFNPAGGLGALSLNPRLLSLQHLFGDTTVVVELNELLLLILKRPQTTGMALGLFAGHSQSRLDLLLDMAADGLDLGGRQLD